MVVGQQVAGVPDVIAHGGSGGLGVALVQGVEDGRVVMGGSVRPPLDSGEELPWGVSRRRPKEPGQPGRVGGPIDHAVELVIELLDGRRVAPTLSVHQLALNRGQSFYIFAGQAATGQGGQFTRDEGVDAVDVLDVLSGQSANEKAPVGVLVHEALPAQ